MSGLMPCVPTTRCNDVMMEIMKAYCVRACVRRYGESVADLDSSGSRTCACVVTHPACAA